MVFLGIVLLLIGLGMWWGYRQQPEKYVDKKTGKPIPARQVNFMAGALAVVGVAMAALGGGDGSEPDEPQQQAQVALAKSAKIEDRLRSVDPAIKSVTMQAADVAEIEIGSVENFTESMVYHSMMDKAGDIVKAIHEKLPAEKLRVVRVVASTEVVDQYNNKSIQRVAGFDYDYPEVQKFNFADGYLPQKLLRFAKPKFYSPAGQSAYAQWCTSDNNRSLSGGFCDAG